MSSHPPACLLVDKKCGFAPHKYVLTPKEFTAEVIFVLRGSVLFGQILRRYSRHKPFLICNVAKVKKELVRDRKVILARLASFVGSNTMGYPYFNPLLICNVGRLKLKESL